MIFYWFMFICLPKENTFGIHEYVVAELSLVKIQNQKQPSRRVFRKKCSENMQQIYRRTPVSNTFFRTSSHKNAFGRLLLQSGDKVSVCFLNKYNISVCVFVKSYIISDVKMGHCTVQKIKFSIEDFFRKCGQIGSFLRIWSYLLKKSVMENFIFVQCCIFRTILKKFLYCVNAFHI